MADIINWDNKFGVIEGGKKVEGVGKDAEIVINQFGGKQSKPPMALHLVDPVFLDEWFNPSGINDTIIHGITEFMQTGNRLILLDVVYDLQCLISDEKRNGCNALISIAKVLQYGAEKYRPNNWRLIPQEEHINHALIHYIAYLLGDTQDEHLEHCMCRLMMAYSIPLSSDFRYNKYIPEAWERVQD